MRLGTVVALCAALAVAPGVRAEDAARPPPQIRSPSASPPAPGPSGGEAEDIDDDVIEHLWVLQRLQLLENLELFDSEAEE